MSQQNNNIDESSRLDRYNSLIEPCVPCAARTRIHLTKRGINQPPFCSNPNPILLERAVFRLTGALHIRGLLAAVSCVCLSDVHQIQFPPSNLASFATRYFVVWDFGDSCDDLLSLAGPLLWLFSRCCLTCSIVTSSIQASKPHLDPNPDPSCAAPTPCRSPPRPEMRHPSEPSPSAGPPPLVPSWG